MFFNLFKKAKTLIETNLLENVRIGKDIEEIDRLKKVIEQKDNEIKMKESIYSKLRINLTNEYRVKLLDYQKRIIFLEELKNFYEHATIGNILKARLELKIKTEIHSKLTEEIIVLRKYLYNLENEKKEK